MKLACTVRFGHDEELVFAQQLGADAVVARVRVDDPTDLDLGPVVHRTGAAGVALAAVELMGLAPQFQAWSNALGGALLAAEAAGVNRLLCASPVRRSDRLAADLEAVVATATATGVSICLDTAQLLPQESALLPAGGVQLELAVGPPPFAPGGDLSERLAARLQAGGVGFVRLEGGGVPFGDGPLDVPACLARLRAAGYDGFVRGGAAPLLGADDDWHPKGAAHDLGYLRAVLQSLGCR